MVLGGDDTRVRSAVSREAVGGFFMVSGGLLAGVGVALPPAAENSDVAPAVCGVVAVVFGSGLLWAGWRGLRAPDLVFDAALLLSTILVAGATWGSGVDAAGTADNEMLFVWVVLFAFYFLPLSHAVAQLAVIALVYLGLLLTTSAEAAQIVNRALMGIGTLGVAGLTVAYLKNSLQRLVRDAERKATTDDVTGALNRRGLRELAERELRLAAEEDVPVGFIAVDLDSFRTFNDIQGQDQGDELLAHVASSLSESVRGIGSVARLGADEFGVLVADANEEWITELAERIREDLAGSWAGPTLTTISIGAYSGPAPGTLSGHWQAAARALESARMTGGDTVRVWRETSPTTPAA